MILFSSFCISFFAWQNQLALSSVALLLYSVLNTEVVIRLPFDVLLILYLIVSMWSSTSFLLKRALCSFLLNKVLLFLLQSSWKKWWFYLIPQTKRHLFVICFVDKTWKARNCGACVLLSFEIIFFWVFSQFGGRVCCILFFLVVWLT